MNAHDQTHQLNRLSEQVTNSFGKIWIIYKVNAINREQIKTCGKEKTFLRSDHDEEIENEENNQSQE